jgi:RNA polymerase sigma-70 factor (ECF subfamily)
MRRGSVSSSTSSTRPGTAETLARLVQRREHFLAFLRRRTKPDEADDLLQLAYVRATSKIDSLRDEGLAEAWFFSILRRILADHADDVARQRYCSDAPELASDTPEPRTTCDCSLQLMEKLPAQYAEILHRIDVLDETVEDAAAALATTPGNVLVRLHRARKALRGRLLEQCGTTSSRRCIDCQCESVT